MKKCIVCGEELQYADTTPAGTPYSACRGCGFIGYGANVGLEEGTRSLLEMVEDLAHALRTSTIEAERVRLVNEITDDIQKVKITLRIGAHPS
jgi:hypothetical protein